MAQIISYGGYGNLEFSDEATEEQIKQYVDDNYKAIENRFNVPHSDPEGFLSSMLPDSLERGVINAKKAFNVLQMDFGINTPDEALYDIRRYEQRARDIPMDEDDRTTLTNIVKAKNIGDAFSALANNPSVILPVLGESIGQYLPTIAFGAAPPLLLARGLGGSLLAAVGTGTGSGATEYGNTVLDALAEAGVDTDDGYEMAKALSDPKKMAKAREYGLKRGLPIGAFDAASFGMAGVLTRAIRDSGRKVLGSQLATTLGASGAEIAQAGSLGALGEYVAQVTADGKVTSPGSILLEAFSEGPLGIVEAGINLRNEYKPKPDVDPTVDDGQPITTPELETNPAAEAQPPEVRTAQKNINSDIIRSKIFSHLNNMSQQQTLDGTGGDTIDPQKVREEALDPYERKFLEDMGDEGITLESGIYNDLFDKNIINIESSVDSEGKTVAKYVTFSPFDIDKLNKAKALQEKEDAKPTKKEKIKPSKLKYPFNFKKFETTIKEATVRGITATSPTEFNAKFKEQYGRGPTLQELQGFNRELNKTSITISDEQAESSLIPLTETLDITDKNLLNDLEKSFNKFKKKKDYGEDVEANLLNQKVRKFETKDPNSPGLVEYLEATLQQKIGQRVPTKIIQDQNGETQGQVHKVSLSGRSFLSPQTGQPVAVPGGGALHIAIDNGNPNNNRIFLSEDEAGTYLTNKLKKRSVGLSTVKTNFIPNLPQQQFNQNIKNEIDKIIQENPNIFYKVNGNDDILQMNNDETLKMIDSEIVPMIRLNKIQDLIARGRKKESATILPTLNEEVQQAEVGMSQDAKDINLLQASGISSQPEVNQANYVEDQINNEPTPILSPPEINRQRNFVGRAVDTLKSFAGNVYLNFFKPYLNSAYHLSETSKPIARLTNILEKRAAMRAKIFEQLQRIIGERFNNINDEQSAKVGKAAVFARAAQTQLNQGSPYRVSDTEIYIPASAMLSNQLGANDKPIKEIVPRMFKIPTEGIRLVGDEVLAYDALVQMGKFERDLMIEQSLDDMAKSLNNPELGMLFNKTNLNSSEAINKLAEKIKTTLVDPELTISDLDSSILQRTANRLENIAKTYDATYFPLSRTGDKFVSVTEYKVKEDKEGNLKLVKETLFWRAFPTKGGTNIGEIGRAKNLDEQLRQMYSTTEKIIDPETGQQVNRYLFSGVQDNTYNSMKKYMPDDFSTAMDTFMQIHPELFPAGTQSEIMERVQELEKKRGLPTFLTQSYMIPGFDFKDTKDALVKHMNAFATWDSGFTFDKQLNKALTANDFNSTEAKYRDALINYLDQDPFEWQGFRQLAFLYYLTDISAASMNLFQGIPAGVFIGSYAGIRTSAKGQVKAMRQLSKALKVNVKSDNQFDFDALKKQFGSRIPIFNDPDQLLGTVMNPSRANEYLANETTGLMKNTKDVFGQKGFANKLERSTRLAGLMFTTTEAANRLATYINSYELTNNFDTLRRAVKSSINHQLFRDRLQSDIDLNPNTLLDNFETLRNNKDVRQKLQHLTAQTAVEETQFLYGRHVKPRISRGLGALFFQFTEYPTMMLEFLGRLSRRPGGKRALAIYLGALLATSGFMGLPFVTDLSEIYELVTKNNVKRQLYDVIGEATNPRIAEALMLGMSRSLTGTDIGGRVGLGSHPISGGIIDILRGQTGPTRLNIPAISVFQQVMNSYSYAGVDEYGLAFASLLPKFLGAPIKASLYYTDGYKTRNGEMIVLPKDVSTFDAIMSATGFSPADIAREREAIWMAKSLKDLSAPLKRKFYRRIQKHEGRYYRALERGDDSAAKAAMKDLDDVYFDLQRHNDDARDKGQEATIIKLRNATIQNNTANELYGIEQTLSDLPSDIEYQARESLKYIPRGVD